MSRARGRYDVDFPLWPIVLACALAALAAAVDVIRALFSE